MDVRVVFLLAVLGIVQCKLLDSCGVKEKLVNGHNRRRLMLAENKVSGQPAASKMNYLIWDEELAAKASKWAARNKYGHNPNRTIDSGRFIVGENVYWYGTSNKKHNFEPDTALESWWNEYKDFHYHKLSSSDFGGSKKIGHYTQMAWSNSIKVGCGISQYFENGWNNFLVVCNYGPTGNYLGQTPYDSSHGASGRLVCGESDCSRKYGDKC